MVIAKGNVQWPNEENFGIENKKKLKNNRKQRKK